ncbi:MAG: hypothetical protein QMD95_03520 [Candidatus Hodarchaeaceae archaeon]|nr:hypothetical protein [Candidatus Hodarchaeaceae archaeon]
MSTNRAYAAIVALVVGVYLLIDGALLVREIVIDGAFIVGGAVLTLSYFWLIGDYLVQRFMARRDITLMPVLLVLGLVLLVFGIIRPGLASIGLKLSFIIPGLVFALYAGWRLWKAVKG